MRCGGNGAGGATRRRILIVQVSENRWAGAADVGRDLNQNACWHCAAQGVDRHNHHVPEAVRQLDATQGHGVLGVLAAVGPVVGLVDHRNDREVAVHVELELVYVRNVGSVPRDHGLVDQVVLLVWPESDGSGIETIAIVLILRHDGLSAHEALDGGQVPGDGRPGAWKGIVRWARERGVWPADARAVKDIWRTRLALDHLAVASIVRVLAGVLHGTRMARLSGGGGRGRGGG